MSNYANGQPYYGAHGNGGQHQSGQYDSHTYSQQGHPNQTSHDVGDDPNVRSAAHQQYHHSQGTYGAYGASPSQQQYMNTSDPGQASSLPYRQASTSPLGGYQHQAQSNPAAYPSYNPAQYQPQSSYNPQAYGSPQTAYTSNAYQPYIPAAYGESNLNRTASTYNNSAYASQQPYAQPTQTYEYGQTQSQDYVQQQTTSQGYTIGYGGYSQYGPTSPGPPPPPHHSASVSHRTYGHGYGSAVGNAGYTDSNSLSTGHEAEINRAHSTASRVSNVSNVTGSSQPSLPTPPSRNPSQGSAQVPSQADRHPTGRTLPGVPSESESDNDYYAPRNGSRGGYDDVMNHLDSAINSMGNPGQHRQHEEDALFASHSPRLALSPDERPTHNGININYGAFTHDSDAEAAAGLAAMQAADEQEAAEEARRRNSQIRSDPRSSDKSRSDDSDYGGYDLSLAGGGYAGTMHYGDDNATLGYGSRPASNNYDNSLNNRMSSMRSSNMSSDGRASQSSAWDPTLGDSLRPFPTYQADMARVDAGGTGGLTEPSAHPRRLSYEDGDETPFHEHDMMNESREGIPDLFFHPGMSPQRPLPPPPSLSDPGNRRSSYLDAGSQPHQNRYSAYDNVPRLYPTGPDALQQDALSPSAVPRSTSLASARSAPKTDQPVRSKTDADRAKALRQGGRTLSDVYDAGTPRSDIGSLDLPAIPRKKFDPSKISNEQYRKCSEPWALSAVLSWIRALAEEESDLKEVTLRTALTQLFMFKVPTMSSIDADELADKFVRDMLGQNVLVHDEEWVRFAPGEMSGVIFQLTGTGCYTPRLHLTPTSKQGRCYSYHCMRTLKKADYEIELGGSLDTADWATFYKMKAKDVEGKEKWEIELQNQLHEVITSEEKYMRDLEVTRLMMRDRVKNSSPAMIVPEQRLANFLKDVFGNIDAVRKANNDFLLPQLKYRQNLQGPWISGYGDLFREWIKRAGQVYIEYAAAYPKADSMFREELRRNLQFRALIEEVQNDKRSGRLAWDNFLKAPITRLQRYNLLLGTIYQNMNKHISGQTDEKIMLRAAMDDIKATTSEADSRVNENNRKIEIANLSRMIKLRPAMKKEVNLALDQLGRQMLYRGDLQRQGGKGINWVDTHAILFDHYLVLAKTDTIRDASGMRSQEIYDVSKSPIAMDLIVLESTNDPAVVRSAVRGITTVAPAAGRGVPTSDPRLARTTSTTSGGALTHTSTGFSGGSGGSSIANQTIIEQQKDSKEDKVLYPFKVKHLGKTEVYTLYAASAEKRAEWCEAILNAKTMHAEALHTQNAEPFSLRVLADTAFWSDGFSSSQKRIQIQGTPLDRAIKEVEKKYRGQGRPAPISRAQVNCATVFQQTPGRLMVAVGTDAGVYISEHSNPRGWTKSIQMPRVTQIAVLEDFNLLILLSNKVLIAYHLDIVCPPNGVPVAQNDANARKAPQRLSGSKDVSFFVAGKMKDRALVFYQKREGINSIFKILEPVLQKNATSKSRWLGSAGRRGQTEFFREYDEFYIPAETYGLNMFHSSLAISTRKGMEVLTLDKKVPWGVPNLETDSMESKAHLDSIALRTKDLQPLGMFRLSDAEFLVVLSECAVYVNKLGDVSRSVVMEFVGRANNACLYGPYLMLFNDDFVEIRDALNGRLKQVIAGKEVRLLDDAGNPMPGQQGNPQQMSNGTAGSSLPKTVKVSMLHPEYEKAYVIFELLEKGDEHHDEH